MDHSVANDYMAHGFCFLWEQRLVWLHVISDIATGIAYLSIPLAMGYFIFKRRDLPFTYIFVLFALFIFACGTTHFFAAYTVFVPLYWQEGYMKAFTAVVSIIAAILFIPMIPKAIGLPSLPKAMEDIKQLNSTLESQLEELKRKDLAVASSERKYRGLVDNALVGVYTSTLQGKFLYVNDALARIFECETAQELFSSPVVMPATTAENREDFLALLGAKRKVPYYETVISTKTGRLKTIVISATLEDDVVSGMVVDITDQKKLEDQLRQSQKMEATGQLAGGIAHDFNNILSAIIGYGHVTLMKMAKDEPLRPNIEHILEAADRAAYLTKGLLAFSRKQGSNKKRADLNLLISKAEKFLGRVMREDIVLKTDRHEETLPVLADANQLEQVFMNLATNARDAMPKGGAFTIATERFMLDEKFKALHGYGQPGAYALITVSDTGIGMSDSTRQHIFDPFFTTKGVGQGTGLGLSIVYGIVKQHDGYINVYSEPQKGTTFRIYLPLIEDAVEEERAAQESEYPRQGTETILLAEDDASLRKLVVSVLEEAGYTVLTAIDGDDAVKKFLENKDRIKLLLFDLVMPHKSGREAYDEIRKMKPAIRVLFSSGHSPDLVQQMASTEHGVSVALKPISPLDLLKKVRGILDEAEA
jgi:PAS domain S-box-containing protein